MKEKYSKDGSRKRISDRIGVDSKRIMLEFGLALLAVLALSSVTQAAPGDLVGNVTFSQNCASGSGQGITYDGTNLWYSCGFTSSPDLFRADPKTGNVTASYTILDGLGSLAYDASGNFIWAASSGGGRSMPGEIYKIQLDSNKNVTGNAIPVFNTGTGAGLVDGLGLDATVTPNQLYYSPDLSTTIYVFDINGSLIRKFPWNGAGCFNSGVAIGGNLLFEGSDGCNHVWVVDKNTLAPAFNFSTAVAGDPNFRDESMTCDPNTFAPIDVEWSKEAFNPMRAHAFEIPKGTCGFGGKPATPKGNISGIKFNDINGNGIKDMGEPGLANWTITLKNSTGAIIATTQTASDGSYEFSNLSADNYTVGEVLQAGWTQTAPQPIPPGTYTVTLSAGQIVTGKDFGNTQVKKCPTGDCKFKTWGTLGNVANPEKKFEMLFFSPIPNGGPQGRMKVEDNKLGMTIESTRIDTVVTDKNAGTGTATGRAHVTGGPHPGDYDFTVNVKEAAQSNTPRGTFELILTDFPGGYDNSGSLTFGVVSIIK